MKTFPLKTALATALAVLAHAAIAQAFPSRPVHLVVPQAAGTGNDVLARSLGDLLARRLAQPVIVENRAGANGAVAAAYVLQQPGDGYTLLFSGVSNLSWTPLMYSAIKYQPSRDFAGVATVANTPFMTVTGANSPYKDLVSLLAAARAQPGSISFASYGVGNSTHLASELIAEKSGARLYHVPYSGAAATTSVVAGDVQMLTTVPGGVSSLIKGGKLHGLAVTGDRRLAAFPDVPTFKELGLDIDVPGWYSVVVRRGTPAEVIARLNQEINEVLDSPEMRDKLAAQSLDVLKSTPTELDRLIVRDSQQWAPLIKKLDIQQ